MGARQLAAACFLGLAAGTLTAPALSAQSRGKQAAKKVADTLASAVAATAVDSALARTGLVPPGVTIPGMAPGMVAAANGGCPPGTTAAVTSAMPGAAAALMPTAGTAVVGAAKKMLGKSDPQTQAAPAQPCVPVDQAMAQMQAALASNSLQGGEAAAAQQAAQQQAAQSMAAAVVASSPIGMAAMGASAAAPVAGKALGAIRGRLGRGESKESMLRDLNAGRLQLKDFRFGAASDQPGEGSDRSLVMLVEALKASEGRFLIRVPLEANAGGAPDAQLAQRRAVLVATHLIAAGIPITRLAVDPAPPAGVSVKAGDVKVELLRVAQGQ
ncbi:MAG TPA: hypothetical protein VMM17_01420 [Gemmatimonadaceae bacterium]|nr:hypothetical protein [Gemmatimonadaceae bacterium]